MDLRPNKMSVDKSPWEPGLATSRRGNNSWKSSSKPLVPMTHWPNWRYDQHVWWFDPSVFVLSKSLNSQNPMIFSMSPFSENQVLYLQPPLVNQYSTKMATKMGGTVYPIFTHTHINHKIAREWLCLKIRGPKTTRLIVISS